MKNHHDTKDLNRKTNDKRRRSHEEVPTAAGEEAVNNTSDNEHNSNTDIEGQDNDVNNKTGPEGTDIDVSGKRDEDTVQDTTKDESNNNAIVSESNVQATETSYNGITGAVTNDNNGHNNFEKQNVLKKKPFDVIEAHKSLLTEYPMPKKANRLSKLTCHNLEKFTKLMEKETMPSISHSEESNYLIEDNTDLPMYERFAVTHDDIRRAKLLKAAGKDKHSDTNQCNNTNDDQKPCDTSNPPDEANTSNERNQVADNIQYGEIINKNLSNVNGLRLISDLSNRSNLSNMTNPDLSETHQETQTTENNDLENGVELQNGVEDSDRECSNCMNVETKRSSSPRSLSREGSNVPNPVCSNIANEVPRNRSITDLWRLCGKEVIQVCRT